MNRIPAPRHALLWLLATLTAGCHSPGRGTRSAFDRVQPVLERHCVHCHGTGRLPGMPAFDTTESLQALKGRWILPGHAASSRFYQVVAAGDDQPMAMPPTGHAISKRDAAAIRDWITAGAPLPPAPGLPLQPQGREMRSR